MVCTCLKHPSISKQIICYIVAIQFRDMFVQVPVIKEISRISPDIMLTELVFLTTYIVRDIVAIVIIQQ